LPGSVPFFPHPTGVRFLWARGISFFQFLPGRPACGTPCTSACTHDRFLSNLRLSQIFSARSFFHSPVFLVLWSLRFELLSFFSVPCFARRFKKGDCLFCRFLLSFCYRKPRRTTLNEICSFPCPPTAFGPQYGPSWHRPLTPFFEAGFPSVKHVAQTLLSSGGS